MSQAASLDKSPKVSARASVPRTWAGTPVKANESATHYLHLSAAVCERCHGPVLSGWIGRRADDITEETHVNTVEAICLSCGVRPEITISPGALTHIRPFQWEWVAAAPVLPAESEQNGLSAELSQDADKDGNLSQPGKAGGL
jgi:hypothetical protein